MNKLITDKIAKIDNTFIFNAQYRMTAKEQKILYYLISHLNPKNETDFNVITVPIRLIEETLKETSKKWGGFYDEIDKICDSLISKNIKFPTNVLVEGKKLRGRINFFSSIKPLIDDDGQTVIKFSFSPDMKPFLLQLHEYVNIGVSEIITMKNAHAIRMYSIFKSERGRTKGFRELNLSYEIEELKAILGIEEKYTNSGFKDFRLNVLDRIKDEINLTVPAMQVSYDYLKSGRTITGITFKVAEKIKTNKFLEATKHENKEAKVKDEYPKDYSPSAQDIDVLSRSKKMAYENLVEFGIFKGIAYRQILTSIKGSEIEGYEDIFVEKAIQHFNKTAIQTTTKAIKASTFVIWWTKNKIYESGDVWGSIVEKIAHHKKKLEQTNLSAFENRIIAKSKTNKEFEDFVLNSK